MRKITIVGGGQSGLYLAIALLKKDYQVRIVTNRTADEIKSGNVISGQCMFSDSLLLERELGLNFGEEECPAVEGIGLKISGPYGEKIIDWHERLTYRAQSVDQRIKISGWMRHFEAMGGELIIHEVGIADLEHYAKESNLVIVASGKSEINQLFERDHERSSFDKPMRALTMMYVKNMTPLPDYNRVGFNIVPQVGEYFSFPALTTTGPCDIMLFEALLGGPMDCWDDVKTPEQYIGRSQELLEKHLPWEAERCENIELTDVNGILTGGFSPTVRKPIGRLPSGAVVLGMADAVVLNDPITGQGSNNAAKCADIYFESILHREEKVFDELWMQNTFDQYWEYSRWVVDWTALFLCPPPPHVLKLLSVAKENIGVRKAIVDGFNHPPSYFPWFANESDANAFIASHS